MYPTVMQPEVLDSVEIRNAEFQDVYAVYCLNQKWQKDSLDSVQSGFLSREYTLTQFRELIDREMVLILESTIYGVIGYVLVNNLFFSNEAYRRRRDFFERFPDYKLKRVGFNYQILIDEVSQGCGLFKKVNQMLGYFYAEKFDVLVSTINHKNLKSVHAHQSTNWIFSNLNEKSYLIVKEL